YLETALDRLSPLSSNVPRKSPEVAMAFVLDRSGSMQQSAGDGTRLDVARRATIAAIALLDPRSQVSVTVFDEQAYTVVPLQTVASGEQVAEVLGRIGPGGGTSIFPGLVHALRQLRGAESAAKHVVVMTDGLTQPGDFPGVLAQLREAGITVSGVAIGSGMGVWASTVEDIAERGGGAFHATSDVEALPSILSQEAMMLSGAPVEEGPTQPEWVDRSAGYLAALPETLPPIDGFVLSTAKPGADVALVTPDKEGVAMPLLAQWRFGNGQVIALTTEAAGPWTRAWQELDGYPAFWGQAIRAILPGNASPRLSIGTTRQGDTIRVDVETVVDRDAEAGNEAAPTLTLAGPAGDGTPREAPLARTAPGAWRGSFVADGRGDYALTATSDAGSTGRVVHVSYPAILDPGLGGDAVPFLAAATGGSRIASGDPLQRGGALRWQAEARPEWWLLAALGLFMADLAVRYARNLAGLGLFARRTGRGSEPASVAAPTVIV
ncbi:MAG TPA: VWA domain-containing protein, partial [Amaricoccus sp.]|nr:VWA domain-containing protein [Amaricoccus sp.]